MIQRLFGARGGEQATHLPQRRWRIRAPRVFLWGALGAFVGTAVTFTLWWLGIAPLFLMAPAIVLGWFLLLPAPIYLGLDERGVALVIPGWTSEKYLFIPQHQLVRVEMRQGWLLATGTTVEQQGSVSWLDTARQAGTVVPPWLQLHFKSGLAANQIAAPIHLLDQLARDEMELWIYRQGK